MTNIERLIERLSNKKMAPWVLRNTDYECYGCVHNYLNKGDCKYDEHPDAFETDYEYCVKGTEAWCNKEVES